ncbi:hypothetical protein ACFLY4_10240, partial [Chloroflexota bacterium]
MAIEQLPKPSPKKPDEVFGFTEQEQLHWRVDGERFQEIIEDDRTIIHEIKESYNNYGEFIFITASRSGDQSPIIMTFYGLGYHEHRERWLTDEWFWYQSNLNEDQQDQQISKEEAQELLEKRLADLHPFIKEDTQTEKGKFFELLADLTDEDGALAEMEDIEPYIDWILPTEEEENKNIPPTDENLLDDESRERMTMGGHHEAKEFQSSQEHRRDSDWIEENSAVFWSTATVACEQIGPGAIVVDLSKTSKSGGYQFRYTTQGEIELRDEGLDRLLREYNPHREYVVVLLKSNDQYRIHLGDAPPMGWWDSM